MTAGIITLGYLFFSIQIKAGENFGIDGRAFVVDEKVSPRDISKFDWTTIDYKIASKDCIILYLLL